MYKLILNMILNRLREQSTWRGIVVAVTSAGVYLEPKWQNFIIVVGVAVFTALHFTPDQVGGTGDGTGTGSETTGAPDKVEPQDNPGVSPRS